MEKTKTTRRRRRNNLSRASARHSWRGRKRHAGHRYEWALPCGLREAEAARVSRLVEAAIEGRADLTKISVETKVGATALTLTVEIKKDGVPQRAPEVPRAEILTFEQALSRFYDQTVVAPLPGRRRRGPNQSCADARSVKARTKKVAGYKIGDVRLGDLGVSELRADHFQAIVIAFRKASRPASTVNKYCRLLKTFSAWTVRAGLRSTPILAADDPHFKKEAEAIRGQRVSREDEKKLLDAARPHMRALVIGALDTGCRKGELLALEWKDVSLERRLITVRAEVAKSGKARRVPVTSRLLAVLEMRKTLPDGEEMGPECFVFGDELGRRVTDTKTAWRSLVKKVALSHVRFHDLRRECGSRLLEAGVPLHFVREWLGHHDISVTNRYLSATAEDLLAKMLETEKAAQSRPPVPEREHGAQPATVN